MLSGEHAPLINYEALGSDAALSIPTPDHYLSLLYVPVSYTHLTLPTNREV